MVYCVPTVTRRRSAPRRTTSTYDLAVSSLNFFLASGCLAVVGFMFGFGTFATGLLASACLAAMAIPLAFEASPRRTRFRWSCRAALAAASRCLSNFAGQPWHGSSLSGNMLRNPFCFVLQVVALLLRTELLSCSFRAALRHNESLGAYPVSSTCVGDICLVDDPTAPVIIATPMPTAVTSDHMTRFPAIKGETALSLISGHGSSLSGNMLRNPFCFVLQVSRYLPTKCYRSDNRFLVLLPSPLPLMNVFDYVISIPRDLLVCGDVEANPGPTEKEMLSELLDGQGKLTAAVEALHYSQTDIERNISALTDRIEGLEKQLVGLHALNNRVNVIEDTVAKVDKQLSALISKVDDLENRSRRNNLVIYGLAEEDEETVADLERKLITEVFQDKLELTVTGTERCHRLGRKIGDKKRPVIVKFIDYREKVSALKSAYKLKGSATSISEDFYQNAGNTKAPVEECHTGKR
ncbi:uncharacterized protein LOC144113316 [Amblyomma americanum]